MVPLPDVSPVIWVLRMKVPVLLTVRRVQVLPLSVEKVTWRAPLPTAKLFQETYIRPKKGDEGLLSDQPDSRSSEPPVVNASTSSPGDPTVSGLPGADALSAAARSQKNCKERGGRFVVESNRIAKVRPVSSLRKGLD